MRQQIERFNFGKNVRIHEIPFGVDSKKFRPRNTSDLRKKLGISGQPFIVLARSTTDPIKGYLPLLKALDSLAIDNEILLISVGEQNLANLHTERLKVIELPWVNSSESLSQLYSLADIFAMPSLGESFGMMALESMACATPVLAIEGTATAELVGDTGFLVDPKQRVKGIESEIRHAIENLSSTKTRGNEAQARAEQKFSFDLYVSRMADLYNELAAR
jgi:glycosyltransferase involved in cell wall biosynthesis